MTQFYRIINENKIIMTIKCAMHQEVVAWFDSNHEHVFVIWKEDKIFTDI